MTTPVENRFIFHITHIDNLPAIITDGCLWSDHKACQIEHRRTIIGYDKIKKRRLEELTVKCHPGTFVGQYVPFYFCPRSPMLYVIYRRNAELDFQGGQEHIVHLVSKIDMAIEAAEGRPWAFSDGNAGAEYTQFSNDLARIDEFVNWNAVNAKDWSDPAVKERKQAEFLVHESFPWTGFLGIGVINQNVAIDVQAIVSSHDHQPKVKVKPEWYY